MLKLSTETSICFHIFRCHHRNKFNSIFLTKHFIGPTSDRSHTLDSCNTIVCNKNLKRKVSINQSKKNVPLITLLITRPPPRKSQSSFGVDTEIDCRKDVIDENEIPDIFLQSKKQTTFESINYVMLKIIICPSVTNIDLVFSFCAC